MSFQICIKTEKSLRQLAEEIRSLLSLPAYRQNSFSSQPYCQFEMLGMFILIQQSEEQERDPEVMNYAYCFDLQLSFADHELNTDEMEYRLQPYYAQLLSFRLGLETAYQERQKSERSWKMRYHFCCKNPRWNESILYGEPGWEPAVIEAPPSPWRAVLPPVL